MDKDRQKQVGNDTQEGQVLAHLKQEGEITSMTAIMSYGITRLAAVIWTLRHKYGYDITSVIEYGVNSYGHPCRFARYLYDGGSNGRK